MSRKSEGIILVTGATGQIGSELTIELRKRYDNNDVIAAGHRRKPSSELLNSGPFIYIDVSDRESLEKAVTEYNIDTIYHLAAVLSVVGEEKPALAWHVNMAGLYNVLEITRDQNLVRVFWPSSIAVFGPEAPRSKTPQNTILVPQTMYGVSKVAGELLCNYYFHKFGVDIRSVRYPGIISSTTPPGGGTTDYAVEIFYEAIKRRRYSCFVREDTVLPMMYMPDCIRAAMDLMEAPFSNIKCRTSYNLSGMSFSASELASEIQKHIPEFTCKYEPDFRQRIADSWPMSIDDTFAQEDWNWQPNYDLVTMTEDMITNLSKRLNNEHN